MPCSVTMASLEAASYVPGDVVRSAFGVGVLVACPLAKDNTTDGIYQLRLWRIPGRSIGSSSVAYLRSDAVSNVQ